MNRNQIIILDDEDRLDVAKILCKNGYSVRTVKVNRTPNGMLRPILEYWEEEDI